MVLIPFGAPFSKPVVQCESVKSIGANVVRIEAEALRALSDRIAGPMAVDFERAVDLLNACAGRVVVTGMGKSGIVGRKIAATLSSTGTPALFLHPAEAIHGDLGVIVAGDVVVALSASGETEELLRLLATVKRLRTKLISLTCDSLHRGNAQSPKNLSTLAAAADVALDCSVAQEACSLGLAPTASTTSMVALGDALAVALAEKKGFREEDFADLHPGGKLGKRLARVEQLMHSGDALPRVSPGTKMTEVIYEMSRKGLGLTTVIDGERLIGVISDGDLRRQLEKHGRTPGSKDVLELTARECMTADPKTIAPDEFATAALAVMEERKITSLVVTDRQRRVLGIVHLHDLWGTESI
jgi:arabinose-5-phosphate isomerase